MGHQRKVDQRIQQDKHLGWMPESEGPVEETQAYLFIPVPLFKADPHGRAAKLTLKDVRGLLENLKNRVMLALWA